MGDFSVKVKARNGKLMEFATRKELAKFLGRSTSYVSKNVPYGIVTSKKDMEYKVVKEEVDCQEVPIFKLEMVKDNLKLCLATKKLCSHVEDRTYPRCGISERELRESTVCPLREAIDHHVYYRRGGCYQYPTGEIFRAELVDGGAIMGLFITEKGPRVRYVTIHPMDVIGIAECVFIDELKRVVDNQQKKTENIKASYLVK